MSGVLDVEGYVPKEAILDTGATKVMLSKNFAAAMAIHAVSLAKGTKFVTASGAIEVPLGVTYSPVEFNLGRGTPHALSVKILVSVVDTTAYDMLLGTEFMAAVRGAYDSYTEMFTYRWNGVDGRLQQYAVPAPCHSPTPPLIAYACFGGLLNGESELQDVEKNDDMVIPTEEDIGYHASPLQLAALHLQNLAEEYAHAESVRLCEEVRVVDLARRGDAVDRLVNTIPLALQTLLPSSKWLGDVVHGVRAR